MNCPKTDREVLARRAARFKSAQTKKDEPPRTHNEQRVRSATEEDYDFECNLVGTCELLEKCYLRLTSAPKESDVRPRHILIKSLDRVKELWEGSQDYKRASELLKSIRQDMTVQGIRDQLSIDVYETHATYALHARDPAEFNVCLSVLESLYLEIPPQSVDRRNDFIACRILYYLYTRDLADLTMLLGNVLNKKKTSCHVGLDHAVDVAIAWFIGSYQQLLHLYKTAPPLSLLVMDLFIDLERLAYFRVLMTAYRPNVPVDFISSELVLDKYKTSSFLVKLETVFTDASRTKIDCKATLAKMR